MGCDIHLHVEKWDGAEWHLVHLGDRHYEQGLRLIFDRPDDGGYVTDALQRFDEVQRVTWWAWRNYRLFWELSGVRGPEYRNMIQACTPDLPVDVSKGVEAEWIGWGMDGHTPGWLTLREAHDERLVHADPRCWPLLLKQWTEVADGDLDKVRIVLWYDN